MNKSFTNEEGDRDNVPNILIVMTDGKSYNNKATEVVAADLHKSLKAEVRCFVEMHDKLDLIWNLYHTYVKTTTSR
ncbi:hypothetical protein DPMN_170445 [Dreissena polymorpha]|uniref:VWFA domain-containing protein n=1 Tax=Dreissena polymorpha TaxID=45954 RepID=A0A9D4DW75_DREPO|nr:hypothetical protein DPMN_170445 [Dreissena polymorpha]